VSRTQHTTSHVRDDSSQTIICTDADNNNKVYWLGD